MTARDLSQKQLNFARISIVCIDIVKLPLEDILNIFIKPTELDKNIRACPSLRSGDFKLNSDQKRKCCYKSKEIPNYSKFDVSLLYKLIRNLCPDPSLGPTNNWGKKPTINDLCVVDDIERIRELRNASFAHTESAEISDDDFKKFWHNAKCIIHRCQQFTTSNGCKHDYNQMILDLERQTLTFEEYTSRKERSGAIYILGDTDILCGETACFEAEITLEQDVDMPVSWDRVDGSSRKQLDIKSDKYKGSSSTQLLIHRVRKDDEAGYQAVISRNQDVKIFSNEVYLRAMGERPCLEELSVTAKYDEISIHYVFKDSAHSPNVNEIRWTKNALMLDLSSDKYRGGRLADNCITILCPSEEDKGEYTCTVSNAVGSDSKKVKLDIPSVEIPLNGKVIFGSETRFDCHVFGYPSADKVEWQNSLDGTTFHPIDIDDDKYFGSSSDPCSPFLLVRNATLNDQQYYRAIVSNVIGNSISNKLFLQVTGNRPNIAAGTCILLDRSVKLKCDVFLYDESPALNRVYWTKNDAKLDISRKDGKYSGMDDPSLTINNVNYKDAGYYQLTAVNAVGETKSEIIILGPPEIILKEKEKKEDGSLWITMKIKSVPVPHFVQWSIRENTFEAFQPINVNAAEFKGTTNYFPNPLLVIKHRDKRKNCSFEIKVHNLIGEGKKTISDESNEDNLKTDQNTAGKFYADGGSRLPFCKLLFELADEFPTEKIRRLKNLIELSCNIEDVAELKKTKTAEDCFLILQKENIFTPSDVIAMQFLLQQTKCEELEKKCIEYAKKRGAMCYYEQPPENGYRNVRFHVVANLHNFSTEDETKIRETVAIIVGCSTKDIRVNGYLHSTSFFIVLSINEIYIERLLAMKQHDKDKLRKLNIDFFEDDVNIIKLERTADVKNEDNTVFHPAKGSSEEYTIANNKSEPDEKRKQMTQNNPGQLSLQAVYEKDILMWKEDDSVYYETHNFSVMLDQVRKEPYITFVGVPGSGKTATVRHIALILQKEGYEILPIVHINEIEDFCNSVIPQVFVIEDVLGVFKLHKFELHMIKKYRERLLNPTNSNTKILMTCREAVFRNEMLSDCVWVKNKNVVHLQSNENALNDDDKHNLLKKYKIQRALLTSDNLASSSNMFPLLCTLYSNIKKLEVYGPTFFLAPVPCIMQEMNSLKKQNKYQYVALVILMANENKLSEKLLDNENKESKEKKKIEEVFEKKCSILRKCNLPSSTSNCQLIDALSEMEGTYTRKSGSKFTFIHDFLFEIIAYHFGRQFPELILQYGSSDYIANYIKIDKDNDKKRKRGTEYEDEACEDNKLIEKKHESETAIDLCIQLHESQYPVLAERLLKDVQNGEFYNVFGNEALKNPFVLQYFIAELNKRSYYNIYNLLLSEFNISSEIANLRYEPAKSFVESKKYRSLRTHIFLIEEMFIANPNRRGVRGIEWVIFFGHSRILQYLLNQMMQENGNIDDLFQTCLNKRRTTYSKINQGDTATYAESLLNGCMIGELDKKPDNVKEDYIKDIDTDSSTESCTIIDTDIDSDSSTESCTIIDTDIDSDSSTESCTISDTDINSDSFTNNYSYIKPYGESVIFEQYYLLCLSCCSGDLRTVQILVKYATTEALKNKFTDMYDFNFKHNPLIIACEDGYLSIVMELLKAGADVNSYVFHKTPLTVACENERHSIVKELLKTGADVNLNTPLVVACRIGNLDIVKELIKTGADVNLACAKKQLCVSERLIGEFVNVAMKDKTPLMAACDGGHFNVIKLLMKSGANVHPKENDKTPIIFTWYWEHLKIVKMLIEMESNVDINDEKEMSLITACERGQLAVVKDMIKGGADVNVKNGYKTPLIVACYNEHVHIVKELINAGVDVNLGNEFISPLQVICYEGHSSMVREFYKAGFKDNPFFNDGKALIGACFFGHLNVVKECIACHVEVNVKNGKETPLTTASYMGFLNIVKELIQAGADVNLNDGDKTPLTTACYRRHINIVEELIKAGADVNQSDGNKTLLTAACERGHREMVKELIKGGANVNQSDENETPLTAACVTGHWVVVKDLIMAGANINQSDGNKTPLTAACVTEHWFVVKELIKAGANINLSDGNKTPLTAACDHGDLYVVKELIKADASVNQNDGNKTPLTAACDHGELYVVKELIKAGANVNQSDGNKTPLTAAFERGHCHLIEELIEAGADIKQIKENRSPLTTPCGRRHRCLIHKLL